MSAIQFGRTNVTYSTVRSSTVRNPWLFILAIVISGLLGGMVTLTLPYVMPTEPHSESADGSIDIDALAARLEEQQVRNELGALRSKLNQLEMQKVNSELVNTVRDHAHASRFREPVADNVDVDAGEPREFGSFPPPVVPEMTKAASGQLTLTYWNTLNEIIEKEAAMRAPPTKLTAENALNFVSARSRAARFAADAIKELPTTNVDPDAVSLGHDLVAWYEDEFSISGNAQGLLLSSDIAARKGAAGKNWKTSEEQHRRDCHALNQRGKQLQVTLSKKYDCDFPPLK